MPRRSIKECASQFAQQWTGTERPLFGAMDSSNHGEQLQALQKAAGHFRIARNFAAAFDTDIGKERLAPVLECLRPLRSARVSADALPDVIDDLSLRLARAYGGRQRLSAASKFLWLLKRDPVIIYDENARDALDAPPGHYREFLRLWFAGYELKAPDIRSACDAFSGYGLTGEQGTEWFRRRVYDIYLWNVGD